jgi:hypothetical protein
MSKHNKALDQLTESAVGDSKKWRTEKDHNEYLERLKKKGLWPIKNEGVFTLVTPDGYTDKKLIEAAELKEKLKKKLHDAQKGRKPRHCK